MKFFFQFTLITTLLFKRVLCQSIICEVIQMEPGQIFITRKMIPFIIQSDRKDIQEFNYSDYSIIRNKVKVKNYDVNQIIQAKMLPSFSVDQVLNRLFCQLRKTENYFISCIEEVKFNQDQAINAQDLPNFQINLSIEKDEDCQEFYFNQNSEFLVFCFSSSYLSVYNTNFQQQTTLLRRFQFNYIEHSSCKRSYYQINDNHYIISFQQCYNWACFTYYENQIYLILNEDIAFKKYSLEIKYLEKVEECQLRLFLIAKASYYQFSINKQNKISFNMEVLNYENLKQILFYQTCSIVYYIKYVPSVNKTIIFKQNYSHEFDGTQLQANLFQNILIIKHNDELQIIYNEQFQQVNKIDSAIIKFDKQYNVIYQFDPISDEIIFYYLSYPKNFIQPTKKYVILIHSQTFPVQYDDECFEINYTSKTINSTRNLSLVDECQYSTTQYYSKSGLNLMNEYQIVQPSSTDLKIDIFDKKPLFKICLKLQKILKYNQNSQLLYYEKHSQQSFLLLKSENCIYKYNCEGYLQLIIQLSSVKVFSYENSILFWYSKQGIKLIEFKSTEVKNLEIQFESEIINIFQFQNFVLVQTKNLEELRIIDINLQHVIAINLLFKRILKQFFSHYFQSNLTYHSFYYSNFITYFLQLQDYVIIDANQKSYLFRVDQIQIVYLKQLIYIQNYILSVHLMNNQIIEYMLDQDQISVLNVINLTNYEIIRPLEYQINDNYFSLGVRNASNSFILLFAIKNLFPIQLLNTIQIGRVNFWFQEQYLLYYDQNDVLILFNLANFEVQIDNFKTDDVNEQQYNFQLVPIGSNNSPLNLSFTLQYYNNCYQLISKSKYASLNYSKNKQPKVQISHYVIGPIDQLTIVEQENFQIDGPLILNELTPKELKIKTIELGSIFTVIPNFRMKFVQFENSSLILINNFDQLILNDEKELLLNQFLINEQSILFLFLKDNQIVNARIYLIDEINCNLRQDPIFKINISFSTSQIVLQSFRTGNLIVIQTYYELFIYEIVEFSIKKIDIQFRLNHLLKINGDNQLYISLTFEDSKQRLVFQILFLNGFQFQVQGTATLNLGFILAQLEKYLKTGVDDFVAEYSQFYFLDCMIEDEIARIQILQIIRKYTIISEIIITMQKFELSYRPLKFIRNNANADSTHLKYYEQNNLILKTSSDETYFYDLSEHQNLYDYIGKQVQSQNQYHKLNTTHFIMYIPKEDQIFIAKIGYQVFINTEYQGNKSFTLVAENMLSNLQLIVQIQEIKDDQINYNNRVKNFLIIFGVIVVFCFLIRRMRLKHRQVKNQNFSGLQ